MRRVTVLVLIALSRVYAADDAAWRALVQEERELRQRGDYQAARNVAQTALDEAERLGSAGARTGITLDEIAELDQELGHYPEAENSYLRAVRILEAHPSEQLALAKAMNDLATLYEKFGQRYGQAEQLRRRVLAVGIEELGPKHPEVGMLLSNLATVRYMRGDFEEARQLFKEALALLLNPPAQFRTNRAAVLSSIAVLHYRSGEFSAALACLREAIPLYEEAQGRYHPNLVLPLIALGGVHWKLHELEPAEQALRRAAEIATSRLGPEHPLLVQIYSDLAVVRRKAGHRKEAGRLEAQSRAILALQKDQAISKSRVDISDLLAQSSRSGRSRK